MAFGFWKRRRPQKITENKLPKRSVNDVLRNKFSEYDKKAQEANKLIYGDETKGSLTSLQNDGNKIGSSYYDRPSETLGSREIHKQSYKYTPYGVKDGKYESGSLYGGKLTEPGNKKLHGLGQRVTKKGDILTTERGEFEKGVLSDGVKDDGTTTEFYKRGKKIGTMKRGRIVNGFDDQQKKDLQTTLNEAEEKKPSIKFPESGEQGYQYETEGNVQRKGTVDSKGKLHGYGSLIQKGEEGDNPIGDGVKKGIYTGSFKNGKLQPGGQVTRPGPNGNITSILAEDGSLIPVGDENTFDALPTVASNDIDATSTVFGEIEQTAGLAEEML